MHSVAYQNIAVDVYQAASPAVGVKLFDDDMLRDIYYICEKIFQKRKPGVPYPKQEIEEYFEEFHTIISFFKHIEITLDFVDLDWERFSEELIRVFPQIAWIGGTKEKEDNRVIYYFDFVPIAYREEDFPFVVNLAQSLEQQLFEPGGDVIAAFIKEIENRVLQFICPLSETASAMPGEVPLDAVDHSLNAVSDAIDLFDPNENSPETQLMLMTEALNREKYSKERMRLANQKLEVVIDQMERHSISRAMSELTKAHAQDNDNWDRILKIDLREYSQLIQKAKFLEQTWLINQELVTKSEKMTISESQLTYEREQVRSLKESVSTNEIYLILDECKLIESRVKIKKKLWFRQPSVRIMKMDYDSLLNKAAYFDLIQGENYLLERMVRSGQTLKF